MLYGCLRASSALSQPRELARRLALWLRTVSAYKVISNRKVLGLTPDRSTRIFEQIGATLRPVTWKTWID